MNVLAAAAPASPYDVDVESDAEELDLFREQARERIRNLQGPDTSCPEAIAAYYQELAAWPDWSIWLPPREPTNPDPAEGRRP